MATVHTMLRFDPTRARRALLLVVIACCAASAALSQTKPPARETGRKTQPTALTSAPQSPAGTVIYEGALSEELAVDLQTPGFFGTARLLSLKCSPIQMEIHPQDNDAVSVSPIVMEMVLQYKDRMISTPGAYGYDWGNPVHVRYEWSFLPGRMGDGSNAGFAYITVQERKSRATEEPGMPLAWKSGDVTKGLAEIKATSKVAEPKYRKSEYQASWSNDFYRGNRMFVLKPLNAPAPPPQPPPPAAAQRDSGFLTWYLTFSRLLGDSRNRINDARAVAATIALPLDQARREQRRLVRAVFEALRARQAGEPTASEEITDRLAEKGRLLSKECRKYLAQLDAATADAQAAQDKVMAEFNKGFDAYAGEDLPMWIRSREHFDLVTASLPFEMAIAAGEDVRLRGAVERSDAQTLPGSLRVKLAKAMIARGELALAIHQLHRVLAVEPQNADAKALQARADIVVMKLSMRKASGALGLARESFNNLLEAADHAAREFQPADWMPTATPDAVKLLAGGIDWLHAEGMELVTHTAINVMDRGTGRTVSEARALAASEREYAGNFMAVPIMMRLRAKGFTLEQMAGMNTAALKAALPLNTAGGVPYTDAQVTRLGVAIRNALAFEDIAALRNQDMDVEDLKRAFDRPYLNPADMIETWVDEFGSMVVEQAILLALPMGQLSAGGATVTEFLGHITRYEKAVGWFGGTETGLRLLKPLKQYQVLQETLMKAGSYGKFAGLKVSEMMAMMMVENYAISIAEARGGEPAAAVTAALSMMVTDLDLLTKWLEAGSVPTRTALRVMAAAIRQAQADVQRMEQGGAMLKRLRELSRPKPAGQQLAPADTAFVRKAEPLTNTFIPNGDPLHDSNLVRAHLAEDASSGATSDAALVSEKFEDALTTRKTRVADEVKRAEAARLKLAAARPAAVAPGPRKAPEEAGAYEIPLGPAPGSAWAHAEQALRDGDYVRAKMLYRESYDNYEMDEKLWKAFDRRSVEAETAAKKAAELPLLPPGPKQPTSAEFAPGQVERELEDKWPLRKTRDRSDNPVMSKVFNSADDDFILKEIEIGKYFDDDTKNAAIERLYRAADNEIVAARLMDALGMPCARVGAMPVIKEGNIISIRLLMRKIDGTELADAQFNSGQLLKYAEDLSAQRAFSIVIGDYDRKLANVMLGNDGRLYYIDAGMAYLHDPILVQDPKWKWRARAEEGLYGQDHYYSRSWNSMQTLKTKNDSVSAAEYDVAARTNLVERSLTANAAEPMVRKIENLLAPENEAALLDLLTGAYRESRGTSKTVEEIRKMAVETLKTMRIRQQRLPEVLNHLNERNGIKLPDKTGTSRLLRFPTPQDPVVCAPRLEWRVAA